MFYAIGNIGDSKKSDASRLTDQNDKYECCIEIMDVELPLSDFPADTMMNAMGYKEDETTHEIIYTWAKNENLGILYEKIDDEYVLTTDTEVDLTKTYYVDILEHDDFSEDFTYGWRYIYEDGTDEENAEVFDYCKQKWIEFYRFVTTSTDEEFKARLGDYFVVDSALYYYLFTTRYCLADNRAKNSFWHYGKTNEVDSEGNPIRKWSLDWAYDLDTALGLNNYGKQVYRYGLEDTDVDEKGEEIFRESDSTFFCRIRDLYPSELKAMYQTLESQNTWHAESFINQADELQSQFPEELWRLDIERKYIRTYNSSFINGKGDSQFLKNMANGKMKYHRRQWERSQEQYMASKYQSNVASSDENSVVMRCTAPSGDLVIQPNYKLKLTPYSHMYLNVEYSSGVVQIKAVPNVEYEIPFAGDKTDIIKVYSASCLQSLGDLSSCYLATIGTGAATKLKELIIGSSADGYDNPYFTTLTTGSNYLLEKLNVENVSGLTQSLNLSALGNLCELYAHGSNASGVTFANGGNIEIAELPAITSLSAKNLMYLTNLDITSYDKLTALTIENCSTINVKEILETAPSVNRVRIIGIDWNLEDTSLLHEIYEMYGFDVYGYNITQSVLAGNVFVPTIKQQELRNFTEAWPDLNITYNTMIEQFAVTFQNDDGVVLDVQYVDKGSDAVDPITREENPIAVPTKESTVDKDYTYAGWDISLTSIFSDRVITATYSSATRKYTARYISKGTVLQSTESEYGTYVLYEGGIPVYTAEESAYAYHLFDRWNNSGYINGNKDIEAIFDRCEYVDGYFDGKELSDLRPVEIYAMKKLGLEQSVVGLKDSLTIELGHDYDYDDVEAVTIIEEPVIFDGSNYIDTEISIMKEDRDFVLAIDYVLQNATDNAVLAQCYQSDGSEGFKLWYQNGLKTTWGTSSVASGNVGKRDMLVLRHKKGETGLHVYRSNLSGTLQYTELSMTRTTEIDSTLVFGCAKADDGAYENYAKGIIHWAKVWYTDLGDGACRKLAAWTHESISVEMAGFKRYYLSDNSGQRSSMTFLSTHALDMEMALSSINTNTGGWNATTLNTFLNERFYAAFPDQWRQLLKQVKILSSAGNKTTDIVTSNCYIAIPSAIEVDSSMSSEPYSFEGTSIPYLTTPDSRKRGHTNSDESIAYWLRSPNYNYTSYFYQVDADGNLYGYYSPYVSAGIVVIFSI